MILWKFDGHSPNCGCQINCGDELEPDYEAAHNRMQALMPEEWEREPWPMAFAELIVDAALRVD